MIRSKVQRDEALVGVEQRARLQRLHSRNLGQRLGQGDLGVTPALKVLGGRGPEGWGEWEGNTREESGVCPAWMINQGLSPAQVGRPCFCTCGQGVGIQCCVTCALSDVG